jgi:hypothetical protein
VALVVVSVCVVLAPLLLLLSLLFFEIVIDIE